MTTGLIIGKFKPLTNGHNHLITTAFKKVDRLIVIIAGTEHDIPHPKYRLKWMQEIYNNPNILIIRINDIYDPDDNKLWSTLTKKWLGIIEYDPSSIKSLEYIDVLTQYSSNIIDVIPDYVFTSELYGEPWANNLNLNSTKKCKHILVDLHRQLVPISATQVRKDPFKYKNFIDKRVYKFYTKRFVFIGPECVYKTRIIKDISKILNLPFVSEYGDEFCNQLCCNQSIESIEWTDEMFYHIAETQNNNENILAENNSHILCDTNILSTIIFSERYMGYELKLPDNILDHLEEFKINTIYILMNYTDVNFQQNGTNTREIDIKKCPITIEQSVREWMYNKILKKLNDNKYNYHKLSGTTYEQKLNAALTLIKNQLIIDNIIPTITTDITPTITTDITPTITTDIITDIVIDINNNNNNNNLFKYSDLFKSLYLDLYIFSYYELSLLVLFIIINFIFTFIDFNQIIYPQNNSIFQWDNDIKNNIELWRRIIYLLSGIVSFTGVLSVVMATKKRISTYLWGTINCIFFGLYAFAYGYIGNFQLNIIFFLPLQFFGIYKWHNKMEDNNVIINKCNLWDELKIICCCVILCVIFYYEIPVLTKLITNNEYIFINNLTAYLLDVITTSLSIIAQILMNYRYREQWILWIVIDILQITLYCGIAYGINNIIINIVIMWFIFLCNACNGFYIWYK
jgi:NadR type nicotinamide-nucleotide adenylyltransferase